MPTKRSVSASGNCKERVGTRMVEVPNPVIVPRVEAINVSIRTNRFSTNPLYKYLHGVDNVIDGFNLSISSLS